MPAAQRAMMYICVSYVTKYNLHTLATLVNFSNSGENISWLNIWQKATTSDPFYKICCNPLAKPRHASWRPEQVATMRCARSAFTIQIRYFLNSQPKGQIWRRRQKISSKFPKSVSRDWMDVQAMFLLLLINISFSTPQHLCPLPPYRCMYHLCLVTIDRVPVWLCKSKWVGEPD